MKSRRIIFVFAAMLAAISCVSKETVRIKVRESEELPRGRRIKYEDGTGESREEAIVIIGAKDLKEGVAAEYDFISGLHGKKDKAWRVQAQNQMREGDKVFDIIEIEVIGKDKTHYYYFDITNCVWSSGSTQE